MSFLRRHVGSSTKQVGEIIKTLGVSQRELINKVIPYNINSEFNKYEPSLERDSLSNLKNDMEMNRKIHSMIGLDYSESIVPSVIKRNLLENPAWYTSYTPYQSEISQGRLESLFNYQTLITELTKLPISNCSLLDTGSASVEAMNMAYFHHKEKKNQFFVSDKVHPHIIETLRTRAKVLNLELLVDSEDNINITDDLFGFYFSNPNTYGNIKYFSNLIKELNRNKTLVISHNDLMSLILLKPPGDFGVDISLGSTQRFGLPLWYGGPHSCFFATKQEYLRLIPGRIIGLSKDRHGKKSYRMALQTREQHIRREKATSNICTSQALLANTSAMYAIYHGKEGLKNIAETIFHKANMLKRALGSKHKTIPGEVFSSFLVKLDFEERDRIFEDLLNSNIELRKVDDGLVIDINEATDLETLFKIYESFGVEESFFLEEYTTANRDDNFLNQEIFQESKSETEMMRYLNHLVQKDYSLIHGMIPLGSCTMKLNSASEMEALSWDSLQHPHPFSVIKPSGYYKMFDELSVRLKDITGLPYISFQPNSGAMGEYTGLLCIGKYHQERGDEKRDICLIPDSAHGTNFTSARLAGLKIVKYSDLASFEEFEEIVKKNKDRLSCLMVTYPNTYGVFDERIKDITNLIHNHGGLVYMDGANMNAQSGLTSPGECGADVCHLNLHKTFCIPHGGGGPGMGPIAVNNKLKDFLPKNIYQDEDFFNSKTIGMVTNSNFSSASILSIPYMYFNNMGSDGVRKATEIAILNANYLKKELENDYKIFSTNNDGYVGHEFIIDLREFKHLGIQEKDISKRLLDYSFHPPTMSWPVVGSIMIEPTESEDKNELDRFIIAMKSIRQEIKEIEDGFVDRKNNVLKNSPHPIEDLRNWNFPYSVDKACFPVEGLNDRKFWPSCSRVDDVYGDKNLNLSN